MHILPSNMVSARTGNEDGILDLSCDVQKSLAYIDRYLISHLHVIHSKVDYFKSEIMALVQKFMGLMTQCNRQRSDCIKFFNHC